VPRAPISHFSLGIATALAVTTQLLPVGSLLALLQLHGTTSSLLLNQHLVEVQNMLPAERQQPKLNL